MKAGRRACPRGHGIFRGSCPVCARQADRARGTARQRGYDPAWDAFSRDWLARYPWCGMRADGQLYVDHSRCAAEGRRVPAAVTDHIVALVDGGGHMVPANHQSLCISCNTAKAVGRTGG
jgi:5-methylcytosine-specific restriction endonuclease McrA